MHRSFYAGLIMIAFGSILTISVWTLSAFLDGYRNANSVASSPRPQTTDPEFVHPHAELRVRYANDPRESTLPLGRTIGKHQVALNVVQHLPPPKGAQKFSIAARHRCSIEHGDVYEVIWSIGARLPPKPQPGDYPNSSRVISTGRGVFRLSDSTRWIIEMADTSVASSNTTDESTP